MKKTKVVIASILKPIDDTRMFEKFGLSLEQANKYEIHIIGFASKNIPAKNQIQFHAHRPFERLSLQRYLARFTVLKKYAKVKPDIIIVNTHELLIVTCLYKILFGARIVYDIRENYARNVRRQKIYPVLVRPIISFVIRLKELITQPFFNAQIIAEGCYLNELPFLKPDVVLIENKFKQLDNSDAISKTDPKQIRLLFSGTIAESYGAFDAIALAKALHKVNPDVFLTLIGYCARMDDLLRLKAEIKDCEFIHLEGGDHLVPHTAIVSEIRRSTFGLILNQPNILSDQKKPTRLFEFTANKLPVICINNPTWSSFLTAFNAGLIINLKHLKPAALLVEMENSIFYNKGDVTTSLWKSEAPKLLKLIDAL